MLHLGQGQIYDVAQHWHVSLRHSETTLSLSLCFRPFFALFLQLFFLLPKHWDAAQSPAVLEMGGQRDRVQVLNKVRTKRASCKRRSLSPDDKY